MLTLYDEGLYNQLCQIPGFSDENGHTYRDYLVKNIQSSDDITTEIKDVIQEIKECDTILHVLREYDITYKVTTTLCYA
tara:strand:+ start:9 stop:245 length:237 start_codon:yes stop_codon:yes gene_type:complete